MQTALWLHVIWHVQCSDPESIFASLLVPQQSSNNIQIHVHDPATLLGTPAQLFIISKI